MQNKKAAFTYAQGAASRLRAAFDFWGQHLIFGGSIMFKNITHCLRCGKLLKDSISRQRGYGAECWKIVCRNRSLKHHNLIKIGEQNANSIKKDIKRT